MLAERRIDIAISVICAFRSMHLRQELRLLSLIMHYADSQSPITVDLVLSHVSEAADHLTGAKSAFWQGYQVCIFRGFVRVFTVQKETTSACKQCELRLSEL